MVRAAFNERSLDASNRDSGGVGDSDVEALSRFVKTFDALKKLIPAYERHRLTLATLPDLGGLRLPAGTCLMEALNQLHRRDEVEGTLAYGFLDTPHIDVDELTVWQVDGNDALGLSYALRERSLVVSIAGPAVRKPKLFAERGSDREAVVNAWSPDFQADHLEALGVHVTLLPAYDNPGTHDPSSKRCDPNKSRMPEHALRLLENGVRHDSVSTERERRETWWALCEHGFFHRFQSSGGAPVQGRPLFHWNGTTNPRATVRTDVEHVPSAVRDALSARDAVSSCGCREL